MKIIGNLDSLSYIVYFSRPTFLRSSWVRTSAVWSCHSRRCFRPKKYRFRLWAGSCPVLRKLGSTNDVTQNSTDTGQYQHHNTIANQQQVPQQPRNCLFTQSVNVKSSISYYLSRRWHVHMPGKRDIKKIKPNVFLRFLQFQI